MSGLTLALSFAKPILLNLGKEHCKSNGAAEQHHYF